MIALTPKTQKTVSTPYSRESWNKMIAACKDQKIVDFFNRFRFIGVGADNRYHFKEMDSGVKNYNDELRHEATNMMREHLDPNLQGVDYYHSCGSLWSELRTDRGNNFCAEMQERIENQEYLSPPYSVESWNKMISACKDKDMLDLFSCLRFVDEAPANYYHFYEMEVDPHHDDMSWHDVAANMMQQYLNPDLEGVSYYDDYCGIYSVRIYPRHYDEAI
jgi:hypothetical protein